MVDLTKPMKMGAFVDFNRTRKYSEDDYILPETPPFSWLLRKQDGGDANNNNNNNTSTETVTGVPATEELSPTTTTTATTTMCNKENENKNVDSRNSNNTGSGGVGKRPFGSGSAPAEESKVFSSKLRPSRWSVSPTQDEEKFLKELVS